MNTGSPLQSPDHVTSEQVEAYLRATGWAFVDRDDDTSMWFRDPTGDGDEAIQVVVPQRPAFTDYGEQLYRALRVVAHVEGRQIASVLSDMSTGGADSVSVRLTPPTPSGEAPLETAYQALSSLRNFVIGSAAGLVATGAPLVLPPRRPVRAEAYVAQTRVSLRPGSFILDVVLPLAESSSADDLVLRDLDEPFGRQVATRMFAVAQRAMALADDVGQGERDLAAFTAAGAWTGNATELEALAGLGWGQGGPSRYQVRFARTPLWRGTAWKPTALVVTPSQQTVLAEAARYLRERRSRPSVVVEGLVVRLSREWAIGAGDVVVEGVDDDTGAARRYAINLSEEDYLDALRAHEEGYRVVVSGDLEVRGTRRSLRNISAFDVIPRLGED